MRRDPFQAIADPTRRAIISKLAGKPMNLNEVAGNFDISRPAISKQIKILVECGLVRIDQRGRERYCAVQLQNLSEVSDWMEPYRKFWTYKLDALEKFLVEDKKKKNKQTKKTKK
jgi:DNA-binding transcriptional ArsR family regulator